MTEENREKLHQIDEALNLIDHARVYDGAWELDASESEAEKSGGDGEDPLGDDDGEDEEEGPCLSSSCSNQKKCNACSKRIDPALGAEVQSPKKKQRSGKEAERLD